MGRVQSISPVVDSRRSARPGRRSISLNKLADIDPALANTERADALRDRARLLKEMIERATAADRPASAP